MSDLWPIVGSVWSVFLMILAGAFCRRRGWLTQQADRSLVSLTTNVMLPSYFISKILGSEAFDSLATVWQAPLYGFGFTVLGFAIGLAVAKWGGARLGFDTAAKQSSFALCVGVCNYAYIPLPLAEKFYGHAMIDLILHNVGVEVALWSVGVAIINATGESQWRKAFLNAPLMAVVVSVILRVVDWGSFVPAPVIETVVAMRAPVMDTVNMLGACAIPLGLLLSGAIMIDLVASSGLSGSWRVMVSAIGIRQLLLPILMLAITAAASSPGNLRCVMMLQASMPVALFPIVLVRHYERDTQTAVNVIVSTSMASLVLIPAWLAIGSRVLGV